MKRRQFLESIAAVSAGMTLPVIPESLWGMAGDLPSLPTNANDEKFWAAVRAEFDLDPEFIQLNHGAVSPSPKSVQKTHLDLLTQVNQKPALANRRLLRSVNEEVKKMFGSLFGCNQHQVVFNRNATEGLNTVLLGKNLKRGDEIIIADMDYPAAKEAAYQRQKRDGVVVREVKLPLGNPSEEDYLQLYKDQINANTKLMLVTHVVHHTGQVLPAKKLIDLAHEHGIEVLLDAAHSFAHLNYKIDDLNPDYYAVSLHKWLYAPIGTGALVIRPDKIASVWPLLGNTNKDQVNSMQKFEHLGTFSYAQQMAIGVAMSYHEEIGAERKWNRFQTLKEHWVMQCEDIEDSFFTILPRQTNGIAHLNLSPDRASSAFNQLFEEKIHCMRYSYKQRFDGLRISPNIFTTKEELDEFVFKLKRMLER